MITTETIDLHFHVLEFVYPILNLIIVLIYVYGAVRSPRCRAAFLLLTFSGLLWAFPQVIQALLVAQKDLNREWITKDMTRLILPYTLLSTWVAIPFHLLGVAMVVRCAIRSNERRM